MYTCAPWYYDSNSFEITEYKAIFIKPNWNILTSVACNSKRIATRGLTHHKTIYQHVHLRTSVLCLGWFYITWITFPSYKKDICANVCHALKTIDTYIFKNITSIFTSMCACGLLYFGSDVFEINRIIFHFLYKQLYFLNCIMHN